MISVLVLTRNEQQDLPACLKSVGWSDDIHLYDSFSTDRTLEIAKAAGCKITQRTFDNWSAHQNWGLANIPFKYPWVLYIDADERVSPELCAAALKAVEAPGEACAFRIQRRDYFGDGTWLKHAQITPYYLRLFRPERIRYERLVNPVTIVDGPVVSIQGCLDHYPFSKGLGFWVERHVKYADFEAKTIVESRKNGGGFSLWKALFARDFTIRRYHQKELFCHLPCRPLIRFWYLMLARRAFLDGRAGVTYARLQAFYEFMIVERQRELQRQEDRTRSIPAG